MIQDQDSLDLALVPVYLPRLIAPRPARVNRPRVEAEEDRVAFSLESARRKTRGLLWRGGEERERKKGARERESWEEEDISPHLSLSLSAPCRP